MYKTYSRKFSLYSIYKLCIGGNGYIYPMMWVGVDGFVVEYLLIDSL